MNEDGAFIRAIVASPGDDTPRLIYADWLDDRDDPRGTYLRAEVEWAKSWRVGERPVESSQLREMTNGLDLVWVGRVSRPPVGMCCDHLRFTECGPRLSQDDIGTLQRKFDLHFPEAYQAFLLNYNAGLLTSLHPAPLDRPSECNPIVCFYPLGHTFRTAFETTPDLESLLNMRTASTGVAPLAHSPSDLRLLFLGITGSLRGKVYSDCTVKPEWLSRGYPPEEAAVSFSEYLGSLSPTWGRPRQHEYDI